MFFGEGAALFTGNSESTGRHIIIFLENEQNGDVLFSRMQVAAIKIKRV